MHPQWSVLGVLRGFWDRYLYRAQGDHGGRGEAGLSFSFTPTLSLSSTLGIYYDRNPAKNVGEILRRDAMIKVSWREAADARALLRPRWLEGEQVIKRLELFQHTLP